MRTFIKVLGLCSLLALAIPAYSQVSIGVTLGAPPPPRHEVIVARPYVDAVWAPGYYSYEARTAHYVWMPGAWHNPHERFVREGAVRREEYHGDRGRGEHFSPGHTQEQHASTDRRR